MPADSQYDFVFTGTGCAALSLVIRMIDSGKFRNRKILLIDKEPKSKNDRTWCFWENRPGFFEKIVFRTWDHLSFYSDNFSDTMNIAPYSYKMIRGIDFYNYCFDIIKEQNNIEVVHGNIGEWEFENDLLNIEIENTRHKIKTPFFFNSICKTGTSQKTTIKLLQHFKGWQIITERPVFDPRTATLMDFRISQELGTTFVYVLPVSETSALVEYTLFSTNLLEQKEYDKGLRNYIHEFLKPGQYQIAAEEFGIIPMTDERFSFKDNGWQLGTAGGQTKASSGYTFQFIQKQADKIIQTLLSGGALEGLKFFPKRFRFYDNTLLHILYHDQLQGSEVFTTLFKKNKPQTVLRFLDNESSLLEEIKIISTLPTIPFLRAAVRQI